MAYNLAEHTSNKPLFGFVKKYQASYPAFQIELTMALCEHTREKNQKGVSLCLWAGADPHRPVPDLRFWHDDDAGEMLGTAIEEAVYSGNLHALQTFSRIRRELILAICILLLETGPPQSSCLTLSHQEISQRLFLPY